MLINNAPSTAMPLNTSSDWIRSENLLECEAIDNGSPGVVLSERSGIIAVRFRYTNQNTKIIMYKLIIFNRLNFALGPVLLWMNLCFNLSMVKGQS